MIGLSLASPGSEDGPRHRRRPRPLSSPPALISFPHNNNNDDGHDGCGKTEPVNDNAAAGGGGGGKECRICGESLPDGILYLKHILLHRDVEGGDEPGVVVGNGGGDGDGDGDGDRDGDGGRHLPANGGVDPAYEELIERVDAEASNREGTYVCKVCGKEFRKKYSIACHLKVHTGERPFRCPICSRTFSLASNRRKHMLTHANYKPHKCRLCGHCFSQKGNLFRHLASVHHHHPRPNNNNNKDDNDDDDDDRLANGDQNGGAVSIDDNNDDVSRNGRSNGDCGDDSLDDDLRGDGEGDENDGGSVEGDENQELRQDSIGDVKPSKSLLYQMLKPKEKEEEEPQPPPPPPSLLLKILAPSGAANGHAADARPKTDEQAASRGRRGGSDEDDDDGGGGPKLAGAIAVSVGGGGGNCPLCGVRADCLDAHLLRAHPGGRPYQCDTCVRGFSSRVALINHLSNSHGRACPTCGLAFAQKENLARHMAAADHFPRTNGCQARLRDRGAAASPGAAPPAPLNLSVKTERGGAPPPAPHQAVAAVQSNKEAEAGRNETVQCKWCDEILEKWCDFRGHLKRKHCIKNLPASGRDSKAMREMVRTHGNCHFNPLLLSPRTLGQASRPPSAASLSVCAAPIAVQQLPAVSQQLGSRAGSHLKRPPPLSSNLFKDASPLPSNLFKDASPLPSPSGCAPAGRPSKLHKPEFDKMVEQMQSRIQPTPTVNGLEADNLLGGASSLDADKSVSFEEMVEEIMNQSSSRAPSIVPPTQSVLMDSNEMDTMDSINSSSSRHSESLIVEPDPEACLIKCEVDSDTESGGEEAGDQHMDEEEEKPDLQLRLGLLQGMSPNPMSRSPSVTPTPRPVTPMLAAPPVLPASARKKPPPLIKIQSVLCSPEVPIVPALPSLASNASSIRLPPPAPVVPPLLAPPQQQVANGAAIGGEDTGPQPSIEQVYQKWATESDAAPVEPTFPPNRRRCLNTSAASATAGSNKAPQRNHVGLASASSSATSLPDSGASRADSGPGNGFRRLHLPSSSTLSAMVSVVAGGSHGGGHRHNRISCQLCDKRVFSSQEELGCHVASTHPNHYFCVNCSRVVDGHLDALEEHMASCFKQKLARRLNAMASRTDGESQLAD